MNQRDQFNVKCGDLTPDFAYLILPNRIPVWESGRSVSRDFLEQNVDF